MIHFPTLPALARMLARGEPLDELLPALQRQACEAAGATGAVLLVFNPRTSRYHARGWHGLRDQAPDGWFDLDAERPLADRAIAEGAPLVASDLGLRLPGLSARLASDAALLVPLVARGEPLGLLVLGLTRTTLRHGALETIVSAGEVLVIVLERSRLLRQAALQQSVRQLVLTFSRNVPAAPGLGLSLRQLCEAARGMFGAARAAVWLMDRSARSLVLAAATGSEPGDAGARGPVDPPASYLAAALRQPRTEVWKPDPEAPGRAGCTVTVPLRGHRRALGILALQGIEGPLEADPGLIDSAEELGSQLSSVIENAQLLRDVLRSRRELENTFDAIADLVLVCDEGQRIVNANEAFARRVGRSRKAILDRPVSELVDEGLSRWIARAAARPAPGGPATCEVTAPTLGGTFAVTLTALPGEDGEPAGSVVVARDVTRQTALEVEQEMLRRRLTQSEKLAALGQFVAGTAHELNNPLQGVLGHLELIRTTRELPRPVQRDLQLVYREADRAAKIVRNLLVFAGSRKIVRRRLSINATVSRALALRTAACRAAGITVVRDYDDRLPRVFGDPLLLQQAFLNVIMNAEQALSAVREGRIEVSTRFERERGRIVTQVRDNGGGIPADALSRIFEPFFTTKEVGQGTGLGLAIAYGIVQEHGGSIHAANHAEGGAAFIVELPSRRD